MAINAKKSCCLRIGSRCNVDCTNILTHDGCSLRWVDELRYFGVIIARACTFRCSLNYAKRSFFGAVNGLFGKLLNLASKTVIFTARRECITRTMPWQDVWPSVRLSVRLSVTRRYWVWTYPQSFSTIGSPSILVFPHQTGWQYSDGDPLTEASNAKGMKKRFWTNISLYPANEAR